MPFHLFAQNVVQAVALHHATMNPKSRPNLGPPDSAAHKWIDPAAVNAEQISAITAAVINVKTHVII